MEKEIDYMMRGLWRYFPVLCMLSGLFPASAQLLDPTNLNVPVSNRNTTAVTIAAGNASGQIAMVADPVAGAGDMFHVVTDNAAAIISLVLPGGTEVTSASAGNLGYTYDTYTNAANVNTLLPATFNQAGNHTLIVLPPSQVSGTYTVKVNAAAAVSPVLVIATFFTSSLLRAGATTNGGTFKIGDTVVITGLVFNGGTPVSDATVKARIVNTANLTAQPPEIPLVDFGPRDFAASDGLYTGTYTASTAGTFLAVVRATGSAAPGGNYVRTATASFKVLQPLASFTSFSDAGVDDNANGKPDRLVVSALINVQQAGTYQFGVSLLATNGTVVKAHGTAALALGSQTLAASFAVKDIIGALGVNGPYTMRDAALVYLDGVDNPMVDYVDNAGNTAAYTLASLDRGSLYFTGQNTVTGLDTNADGKFDTLRVQSAVVVPNAGTYLWSARLINPAGTEIAFYNTSASLTAGSNNINFDFKGTDIGQSCSTGVYSVRSVLLNGPGGAIILDHLLDTQSFTPAQFDSAACFLVSVTPGSGSIMQGIPQSFVFAYSDANGASDLKQVSMMIRAGTAPGGTCNVAWVRSDHTIRVYTDAADGGYTYGTDSGLYNPFGNSQCLISYNNPIVESGNSLTMTFSITFSKSFVGAKYIYMEAQSAAGADTGLQLLGTSTITLLSPCDINGDGNTNASDVDAILKEALGVVVPPTHDLNHDGLVNVADLQKVINATLGRGCPTP